MRSTQLRLISPLLIGALLMAGCSSFPPSPTPWIITITATPQPAQVPAESTVTEELLSDLTGTDGGCEHILWPLAEGQSWIFTPSEGEAAVTLSSRQVTDSSFILDLNGQSADIGCTDGTLSGLPPAYLFTHPALPGNLTAQNAQGALLLDSGQLLPYSSASATWDFQADITGTIQIDGAEVSISAGKYVTVFSQQGVTTVTLDTGEVSGVVIAYQTFMEISEYSGLDGAGPLLIHASGQWVFAEEIGPVQISFGAGQITSPTRSIPLPGGATLRLITVSGQNT